MILDAYRPEETQELLQEICPDKNFFNQPANNNLQHCCGNTLDITLVDLRTGERKPTPSEYDDYTQLADRDFTDCPSDGALYAVILENAMTKHGFEPCFDQWWQFTDTDEYKKKIFAPAKLIINTGDQTTRLSLNSANHEFDKIYLKCICILVLQVLARA